MGRMLVHPFAHPDPQIRQHLADIISADRERVNRVLKDLHGFSTHTLMPLLPNYQCVTYSQGFSPLLTDFDQKA